MIGPAEIEDMLADLAAEQGEAPAAPSPAEPAEAAPAPAAGPAAAPFSLASLPWPARAFFPGR